MKISVIVAAYNSIEYISRCLTSLIHQTYKDLEIILVDDGSTDGTERICDEFKSVDSRINVIHLSHSGVSIARNVGLKVSTGDYVTFLDSDDYLELNCYEEVVKYIGKANIIQWNYHRYKGDKEIEKEEYISEEGLYSIYDKNKYPNYFRVVWDKIYKRELLSKYNLEFKDLIKVEDVIFNLSMYPYLENVYVIGKKLSNHIVRKNSLSQQEETLVDLSKKLKSLEEVKESLLKDDKYKYVCTRIERRFEWVRNEISRLESTFYNVDMDKPLISIIIPAYNCESSLEKCLQSIQNQTLTNWECIIVNDGSVDNTRLILDYWEYKDSRFKVFHKKNSGPAEARNFGLKISKGKWIGFVDSDDWIEPNRFELAISEAMSNNVDIVQCSINVYKNNKVIKIWHLGEPGLYTIEDNKIYSTPLYDIGHCWDKIYSAELIKNNNILFANCNMCEDTLFNAKAYVCSGKILSIPNALYNYVSSQGTLSHSDIGNVRKVKLSNEFLNYLESLENLPNFNIIKQPLKKLLEGVLNRSNKIDYVFPYVDNNDIVWQKTYNTAKGLDEDNTTNGLERFRSGENLLKYKFRAIEKWMPWIGTIHLIVSNIEQVPKWIDTTKVHIVLHKDIIPKEYLPTFNSCTIEMFLHNIFGLSEKFIYSNDDCFPNDILKPSFYYTEDIKVKADFHNRKLWHEGDINKVWAKIPINSVSLVSQDTPKYRKMYVSNTSLYELQHIGRPMIRSLNEYVYNNYKQEIENSISQFRESKNFNQSIFTAWCLFHDKGSFETFRHSVYNIGHDTQKIVNEILGTTTKSRAICCNDSELATDKDFFKIEQAFSEVYPNKCNYEL